MAMNIACFGIRQKFSKVPQLSTQELAEWQAEGKQVTLLVGELPVPCKVVSSGIVNEGKFM